MTSLFIIAAILTAGVTIALIRPLMSTQQGIADSAVDTAEKDLALYRRQLAGLVDDREAGRLDDESYESARVEIARRMLAADKLRQSNPTTTQTGTPSRAAGYAIMVLLPVVSMGLYIYMGNPTLPDAPLAARGLGSLEDERTALLSQKPLMESIARNPDSPQSLMIMGLAAQEQGDYASAAKAFTRALEKQPDNMMLHAMLGHALVQANDGTVTDAAMEQFHLVLEKQPENALGLYYQAMQWAQDGDTDKALAQWRDILAKSPANAPWNSLVQEAIDQWAKENDQ